MVRSDRLQAVLCRIRSENRLKAITTSPQGKRPYLRIVVFALLGVLLVGRLWSHEDPRDRFALELTEHVSYQYETRLDSADGSPWATAPEVSDETGRAILQLLDGSERFVVEGEWMVRLDHWPLIGKVYPTFSPPPPNSTLKVVNIGTEETVLWIDLIGRDSFAFLSNGMFIIPEKYVPALRALLDELDAQCETAYRQRRRELSETTQHTSDQRVLANQPDGE